jgi:dipeptidyl aminopeptidase/acylaminoacyl peptidase
MRNHLLIIPVDGGATRDLTPGDYDVPPFSLGGQDDYAFSPDGQEVCYTSNHDEVEALSTNNDLFIVSVNGGAAKKITDNPASDSSPLYSPDGKFIAYRAQVRPGYESDRFRLMLYSRHGGHIRNLTESFDHWIGTYAWDPDSSKIYFAAEDKGDSPIYSISLDTAVIGGDTGNDTSLRVTKNNIKMIVPGHNDDMAVTHDGKSLVFTRMSVRFPNEIFRATLPQPGADTAGASVFEAQEVCTDSSGKIKPEGCKTVSVEKSEVQLTDLNHAVLARVAMSPLFLVHGRRQ